MTGAGRSTITGGAATTTLGGQAGAGATTTVAGSHAGAGASTGWSQAGATGSQEAGALITAGPL